ncbi:PREDICTED: uncharacterized protein LOC106102166 [Papilio polytes]|uniref:uncharacterized protein LOC106102166 n=1 Tax=Papilio polytes TaxID=76194 RepID=UPI000675DC32|nr:PREDICTED: uncharacterized protein LOC106102166 [Papilio polytes]
MLPSMPILFTRESRDGFGNKIEPSNCFFGQSSVSKTAIVPEVPVQKIIQKEVKATNKDSEQKETTTTKKNEPPKLDKNALEKALVRSYYRKVQLRFTSNSSPANKFPQFQELLKKFDPTKETPVDLYRQVEQLFGDEHKDIVEEFLLFLKPGQAAEVGRFMDHFVIVQMTNFINELRITLARKPTVLRKILREMTNGVNCGTSESMKSRILPHLRSNPRLIQMFKSLFPDERPPDSIYENSTAVLDEKFLTEDKGYDVWEFEDENDSKRKLEAKQNLDTMYIQERVFLQHGRLLRPASVTYPYSKEPYRVHARRLAPAHCHLSPPESDDERSSPKRNSKNTCKIPSKRPKKQLKSPTKNIKDVNDNTKHKDCTVTLNKSVKGKGVTKNKNAKEKKDSETKESKRDKKEKVDVKMTNPKRDETAKVKQAKTEVPTVKFEAKSLTKNEDKVISKVNIDTAIKLENKTLTRDEVKITMHKAKIDTASVKIESKSWTRDEDKTMLQVLKGEAGSEQVFGRIRQLLPHRSATEIKERFCHVMNLLQQMAVSEVT